MPPVSKTWKVKKDMFIYWPSSSCLTMKCEKIGGKPFHEVSKGCKLFILIQMYDIQIYILFFLSFCFCVGLALEDFEGEGHVPVTVLQPVSHLQKFKQPGPHLFDGHPKNKTKEKEKHFHFNPKCFSSYHRTNVSIYSSNQVCNQYYISKCTATAPHTNRY